MTKQELREHVRGLLAAISPEQRADASQRICRQVADLPAWRDARVVMCFLSMPDEVQTGELIELAWLQRKQVLAPHVDWDANVMTAVPLTDLAGLRIGRYGVVEFPGGQPGRPADPATIDLVLTPGLAFDAAGYRLGRGGGYFDRFLAQAGFRGVTCGLAFECQRVDELPRVAHDVPIDMLVTEAGVVAFGESSSSSSSNL